MRKKLLIYKSLTGKCILWIMVALLTILAYYFTSKALEDKAEVYNTYLHKTYTIREVSRENYSHIVKGLYLEKDNSLVIPQVLASMETNNKLYLITPKGYIKITLEPREMHKISYEEFIKNNESSVSSRPMWLTSEDIKNIVDLQEYRWQSEFSNRSIYNSEFLFNKKIPFLVFDDTKFGHLWDLRNGQMIMDISPLLVKNNIMYLESDTVFMKIDLVSQKIYALVNYSLLTKDKKTLNKEEFRKIKNIDEDFKKEFKNNANILELNSMEILSDDEINNFYELYNHEKFIIK